MARRLVTVSDTGQLPPEVLAKIGETYISRIEVGTIIDTRVQFAIDNIASTTPEANKIPRYDESGMLTINDGVEPAHPVSLGQLDDRIPVDGVPLATQLQSGLMSTADKTKLDSTMPRKPFPWGAKLSTLEPGTVYYHNTLGYPEGADFSELPSVLAIYQNVYGLAQTFEIVASEVNTPTVKNRVYQFNIISLGMLLVTETGTVPSADPWPDIPTGSWASPNITPVQAAKIDSATFLSTANSVVQRDSSGRFNILTPTSANHAVPKSYADNASNLNNGKVAPYLIDNATSLIDGLMSKSDKAKLDSATEAPTVSTLIRRSSSGRAQVNGPYNPADIANKDYVDVKVNDVSPGIWRAAVLSTGQTASEIAPEYRRYIDRVEFRGSVVYSGTGSVTASIPALSPSHRPGVTVPLVLPVSTNIHGAGTKLVAGYANSTGAIFLSNPSEVPAGSFVSLNNVHWII